MRATVTAVRTRLPSEGPRISNRAMRYQPCSLEIDSGRGERFRVFFRPTLKGLAGIPARLRKRFGYASLRIALAEEREGD
jgi:hypothetical protein